MAVGHMVVTWRPHCGQRLRHVLSPAWTQSRRSACSGKARRRSALCTTTPPSDAHAPGRGSCRSTPTACSSRPRAARRRAAGRTGSPARHAPGAAARGGRTRGGHTCTCMWRSHVAVARGGQMRRSHGRVAVARGGRTISHLEIVHRDDIPARPLVHSLGRQASHVGGAVVDPHVSHAEGTCSRYITVTHRPIPLHNRYA